MKSKFLSLIALLLATLLLLSACGGAPAEVPETVPTEEPEEVVEEAPAAPEYKSALTGLPVDSEEAANRRPVAIMINNIKQSLPQYGLSKAGVVFEALAEGGITRLLAVFDDIATVGQIGTVRSSRPIYIDLAESLDAVYLHIGASPEAYDRLKNDNIDSYDFISGKVSLHWRDQDRVKKNGFEHSVFTSGDRVAKQIENDALRMTLAEGYGSIFNFADDVASTGAKDALKASAVYSPYKTGTYTYDEASGLYKIGQYGKEHIDAETGEQIAFKNVFLLYMNSYVIKGDSAGRLRFESVGEGNGYYLANGEKQEFKWKRDGKASPFKFFDANGAELKVAPGNSYVAILPLNATVNIEGATPAATPAA